METDSSDARRAGAVPPEAVHRLEFDVPWPPSHVATYLVDGSEPVLVDAGSPGEGERDDLDATLRTVGFQLEDVQHALVTHPHTDHIGRVPALREAGVEVYAPRAVLGQLRRDESVLAAGVRDVGRSVGYDDDRLGQAVERAQSSLRRNRRLLDPGDVRPLEYGDAVEIGGLDVEVYRTPGHQIHHASFVVDVAGNRVLFSGDALIEPFRAAALHTGIDHGAYDAIDAFYDAMDTFDGIDADRVCPGHGPVFADLDAAVESTRKRLDELVEATRAAVEVVEPATPLAVAEEYAGEIQYPGQLLDVVGALGTLDRRGDVTYEREDSVRYYRST